MPRAYGYIRVSSDRQAESGLGLAAQRARIEEYCGRALAGITLVEIVADEAVSASQTPFLRRPSGQRLDATVVRGDHIVIAKLDRAFRSLRDCAIMIDQWTARGVVVHVLDIGVATDTPLGQLLVGIMASVAQWESRRIGERIREAMAAKRAQGRSPNGRAPIGYRVGPDQMLLADHDMRKVVARIVRWRDRHRVGFRQIAAVLNGAGCRTVMGREWTMSSLTYAYRVGRATTWDQLLEGDDPFVHMLGGRATTSDRCTDGAEVARGRRWISREQRELARAARRNRVSFGEVERFVARVAGAVTGLLSDQPERH
jgi:site-specific DNA recombinase